MPLENIKPASNPKMVDGEIFSAWDSNEKKEVRITLSRTAQEIHDRPACLQKAKFKYDAGILENDGSVFVDSIDFLITRTCSTGQKRSTAVTGDALRLGA